MPSCRADPAHSRGGSRMAAGGSWGRLATHIAHTRSGAGPGGAVRPAFALDEAKLRERRRTSINEGAHCVLARLVNADARVQLFVRHDGGNWNFSGLTSVTHHEPNRLRRLANDGMVAVAGAIAEIRCNRQMGWPPSSWYALAGDYENVDRIAAMLVQPGGAGAAYHRDRMVAKAKLALDDRQIWLRVIRLANYFDEHIWPQPRTAGMYEGFMNARQIAEVVGRI
jgi:hypothetical protein